MSTQTNDDTFSNESTDSTEDHPLKELKPFTAGDLIEADFPPLEYLVDGIIPEGTSILAAAPKVGKSLMCLNIAVAVARGKKAFGKVGVKSGRVAYIDLDGNVRGTQKRLMNLLQGDPAPENLEMFRRFPRVDKGTDGDATDRLQTYLDHFPDTQLVIVDTLKGIRPKTSGRRSMYDLDYEAITPLRKLAQAHEVSMLFVHHTKQGSTDDVVEQVSGSSGLTAAVDNILVMTKDRGQHDAQVKAICREAEDSEYAFSFDEERTTWVLKGESTSFAKTSERQRILNALCKVTSEDDPAGPKHVDSACSVGYDTIRHLLGKMVDEGTVEKLGRGEYLPTSRSQCSQRSQE